jgi:ribosomal protein S18 acetylase RimI-like enzyme
VPADLLATIERYYDTVPRASARTEMLGPLTLFVATTGWPYYARPRLGHEGPVQAADVEAVRARQRELDVPEQLEWVAELTPTLEPACASAGLRVQRCPLLVLERLTATAPVDGVTVRLLQPADPDLAQVRAAISVGFATTGTGRGAASTAERDTAADREDAATARHYEQRMSAVQLRLAGAFTPAGAVGGGSHSPRGGVTEITGVGVLPAYRRRGIAAIVTSALARDARALGVTSVFCSADSDEVARVYERVGFRRIGTACIAEPPSGA